MIAQAQRGVTLLLIFALFAVFLASCAGSVAEMSDAPATAGTAGAGGFVQLDENTDPRFLHSARRDSIGVLRTDGNDVYLNGNRVSGPVSVPNNGHVRTGPGSGARVDFRAGPRDCLIRAVEFRSGRLYGETQQCAQQVETQPGAARSGQPRTAYQVRLSGQRAEVTVVNGIVDVWLSQKPGDRRTVRAAQEAILTPVAIEGPRDLTRDEVRQRTEWRAKYDFSRTSGRDEFCRRYAATAVEQNGENLKRKCGFSGDLWRPDYPANYEWCMTGDNWRTAAPQAEAARKRQLGQCGANASEGWSQVLPYVPYVVDTVLGIISDRHSRNSRDTYPDTGAGSPAPTEPGTGGSAIPPNPTNPDAGAGSAPPIEPGTGGSATPPPTPERPSEPPPTVQPPAGSDVVRGSVKDTINVQGIIDAIRTKMPPIL